MQPQASRKPVQTCHDPPAWLSEYCQEAPGSGVCYRERREGFAITTDHFSHPNGLFFYSEQGDGHLRGIVGQPGVAGTEPNDMMTRPAPTLAPAPRCYTPQSWLA